MFDVAVITDPAAAEICLDPVRANLLAILVTPNSASSLAGESGLTRQKANYHLHELERHGFIELVEERRRGNVTERIMQATAASYVISPVALDALTPDADRAPDRFSARWMMAVAARLVKEVGTLITGANAAGQPLATFTIDSQMTFASAADRAAFAEELSRSVAGLVSKYDKQTPTGRKHRLVLALHPSLKTPVRQGQHQPTIADTATQPKELS